MFFQSDNPHFKPSNWATICRLLNKKISTNSSQLLPQSVKSCKQYSSRIFERTSIAFNALAYCEENVFFQTSKKFGTVAFSDPQLLDSHENVPILMTSLWAKTFYEVRKTILRICCYGKFWRCKHSNFQMLSQFFFIFFLLKFSKSDVIRGKFTSLTFFFTQSHPLSSVNASSAISPIFYVRFFILSTKPSLGYLIFLFWNAAHLSMHNCVTFSSPHDMTEPGVVVSHLTPSPTAFATLVIVPTCSTALLISRKLSQLSRILTFRFSDALASNHVIQYLQIFF